MITFIRQKIGYILRVIIDTVCGVDPRIQDEKTKRLLITRESYAIKAAMFQLIILMLEDYEESAEDIINQQGELENDDDNEEFTEEQLMERNELLEKIIEVQSRYSTIANFIDTMEVMFGKYGASLLYENDLQLAGVSTDEYYAMLSDLRTHRASANKIIEFFERILLKGVNNGKNE